MRQTRWSIKHLTGRNGNTMDSATSLGKLIVVEGIDASGKRTQVERLSKRLRKENISHAVIDFPRYETPTGKKVRAYLTGELHPGSPLAVAQLYADDRGAARDELLAMLAHHQVVLANRYISSNLGYTMALVTESEEQQKIFQHIVNLEYTRNEMPREDLVLYLDVPVTISQNLMDGRGNGKDRHERDQSYLERVEIQYHALAKRLDWKVIPCVHDGVLRPREEIAKEVWKHVQRFLNQK